MTGPEGLFTAERAELRQILARMSRVAEELDQTTQVQLADLRKHREIWAAEDAERAKQARSGNLGPEWQRLQRRIDLNETSLTNIVSGADGSPEAVAVRQRATDKAAELYAEQLAELESDEPSDLQSELKTVRAEVERLRQSIAKTVDLGNRPYGSIGVAEVRASAPLEET
jgi:hypothetical protein